MDLKDIRIRARWGGGENGADWRSREGHGWPQWLTTGAVRRPQASTALPIWPSPCLPGCGASLRVMHLHPQVQLESVSRMVDGSLRTVLTPPNANTATLDLDSRH